MIRLGRALAIAAFAMLLAGVLGWLIAKTSALDTGSRARIIEQLRGLSQLDANWSLALLRTKVDVDNNYDALNDAAGATERAVEPLAADLLDLNDKLLKPTVDALGAGIREKRELTESFKTQNSVLKNSLRFYSTAITQLRDRIEAARGARAVPPARSNALDVIATELLATTMEFNLTSESDARSRIEQLIGRLQSERAGASAALVETIDVVASHTGIVVRQKELEDALFDRVAAISTTRSIEQLGTLVDGEFARALAERDRWRIALIGYAALMLGLLAFLGVRLLLNYRALNNANAALTESNERLEQRVAERTEDLEQALAELKESQTQLVHTEKMATLGQLVAGIAHEINTPLAYLKSGLQVAQARVRDVDSLVIESAALADLMASDEAGEETLTEQFGKVSEIAQAFIEVGAVGELQTLLDDGLHGIDHINVLVTNLRNFSRIDRAQIADFDVNEGLESALIIARNIVKHRRIIKMFGDLPPITCAPSQINQVFLNLITNACQATPETGSLALVTRMIDGDRVRIDIFDNGTGIADDVKAKIFEPFFTTKKVGEGTGLGLSIVERIVRDHGGEIMLHSKLGIGAKFAVVLPLRASTPTGDELAMAA